MVARLSSQSAHRFGRPLSGAAHVASATATRSDPGGRQHPPYSRGGLDPRYAVWADWTSRHSRPLDRTGRAAAAQLAQHPADPATTRTDPSPGRGASQRLLSMASGLGGECHSRHRYHHALRARRRSHRELSYDRSFQLGSVPEPARRPDQRDHPRASAEILGVFGSAVRPAVRQRRCLLWWAYASAHHWSGGALVFVLRHRTVPHTRLRSQTQLSGRDVSRRVGQRFLVARRVPRSGPCTNRSASVSALVLLPLSAARPRRPDPRPSPPRPTPPQAHSRSASFDPNRPLAHYHGPPPHYAQGQQCWRYRTAQRSLAGRPPMDRRICPGDDQHGPAASDPLVPSRRTRRLASAPHTRLPPQGAGA